MKPLDRCHPRKLSFRLAAKESEYRDGFCTIRDGPKIQAGEPSGSRVEWSIDRRRIHRPRIRRNAQIGLVGRGFIDVAGRDHAVESN